MSEFWLGFFFFVSTNNYLNLLTLAELGKHRKILVSIHISHSASTYEANTPSC